jgi:hypothetical protein
LVLGYFSDPFILPEIANEIVTGLFFGIKRAVPFIGIP